MQPYHPVGRRWCRWWACVQLFLPISVPPFFNLKLHGLVTRRALKLEVRVFLRSLFPFSRYWKVLGYIIPAYWCIFHALVYTDLCLGLLVCAAVMTCGAGSRWVRADNLEFPRKTSVAVASRTWV